MRGELLDDKIRRLQAGPFLNAEAACGQIQVNIGRMADR